MTRGSMINTTYEPFSRQPEYIEVNRGFIASLPLEDCRTVLDLACGTGTLTELLLGCPSIQEIAGLDLSRESLILAQDHFKRLGRMGKGSNPPHLLFLRGTADHIPLKARTVDAAVIGNSFHLFPDQDLALTEIGRVLRPEAVLAVNTSFFAGTYPPGTENLYHQWVKIALEVIQAKDREKREQGLPGIQRKRGTSHGAFSRKWPTPEEFAQFLERHAFDVKWYCHRTIMMNQRSLETIGAYAHMASVLLSGYPVEIASEALQSAAGPAFEAFGAKEVRRLWLEMVAVKR